MIFVLNSIAQHHVVTFALPAKWASRVNKTLEILAIVFMIQGVVAKQSVPWFAYLTSLLPLDFISWYIRFGLRAYNKEITVQYDSALYNDIDLSTIMDIALYSLAVKCLFILY